MSKTIVRGTKGVNPVITVQVLNMECPCGGSCVNADGSYMIDVSCIEVTCEICETVYSVPDSIFTRKLKG